MTVTELRVALTVPDFDRALAFYRDGVGLPQIADWSSDDGKVVALEAGRATLELLDQRKPNSSIRSRPVGGSRAPCGWLLRLKTATQSPSGYSRPVPHWSRRQ